MLAVTTLLIIMFVLVVIALSDVIIVPELSTYVNVPPLLPCFNFSNHTQAQIYATDARRWADHAMPTVST